MCVSLSFSRFCPSFFPSPLLPLTWLSITFSSIPLCTPHSLNRDTHTSLSCKFKRKEELSTIQRSGTSYTPFYAQCCHAKRATISWIGTAISVLPLLSHLYCVMVVTNHLQPGDHSFQHKRCGLRFAPGFCLGLFDTMRNHYGIVCITQWQLKNWGHPFTGNQKLNCKLSQSVSLKLFGLVKAEVSCPRN